MKEIPLTQGMVALVDDDWYDYLMQWKWFYHKNRRTGYAERKEGKKPQTIIKMHIVIMNPPKGMEIDHVDHNGCNNQTDNLRICTTQQNAWSKQRHTDNRSGFIGVSENRKGKKKWKVK